MTTYIILSEAQKEIVNDFNKKGTYIAVICSTIHGDGIVDNLKEEGYTELEEPLRDAARVTIEETTE
jgi:hypothetical protein